MKFPAFLFILLCTLFSCRKEDKMHDVIFKVQVISGNPSYSVKYSSLSNTTKTEGPITASTWVSPKINDRKGNSEVFMTLEGGTGGSYKMLIYIDGQLEKEDRMDDPYGPKTINVQIPDH